MINVILAAASATLAGSALSGANPTSAGVVAAASAPALVEAAGEGLRAPSPARACVEAFSKNICESALQTNSWEMDGCFGTHCRTLWIKDGVWRIPIRHNRQGCLTCDGHGKCDETEYMDGASIEASISATLRYNGPCPQRGCFEGRWVFSTPEGVIYQGTVNGTLGVGTHRANNECCDTTENRSCERCLDAEFIPDEGSDVGTWRIAVEGSFQGRAVNTGEPIPDHLHFSMSGDLMARGDRNGPFVFDQPFDWKFSGTADGVHVNYCN